MNLTASIALSTFLLLIADAAVAESSTSRPSGTGLYLVEFTTGPAWQSGIAPGEQQGFAEHSANLRRLRESGTLLFGARYADKGVILLRLPDETAVRSELEPDSALAARVFEAAIHEFRPFYPGEVPAGTH